MSRAMMLLRVCGGLLFFLVLSISAQTPQIFEDFNGWTGTTSPDGLWRRDGNWNGTGGNLLSLNNCVVSTTYNGQPGGYLTLTVTANKLEGGEVSTIGSTGAYLGYGYYEVRMKVTNVSGCVNSFFWIESKNNTGWGPDEIDVEFLTNESWISPSATSGSVRCMEHKANPTEAGGARSVPFNPTTGFHRYGFLWTASKINWTADGKVIQTLTSPVPPATKGYIMMNAWTGQANWGGGPPTQNASVVYDWVKFWPNATSIPSEPTEIQRDIKVIKTGELFPANFPNPLRDLANISFPAKAKSISLYNISGSLIKKYNARDGRIVLSDEGAGLRSGVYLLDMDGDRQFRKVTLIR